MGFLFLCIFNNEFYGTIVNGYNYHYIKNIFGDILGLVDQNGSYVADYVYDAWGNILSSTDSISNPIRYKGYYYDSETDMYYCHTRYYVPKWLRWLNSDNVEYLDTDDFAGINLFVYCGNNPVIASDPDGTFNWKKFGMIALSVVCIVGGIALAVATGPGAVVGAALIGAGVGSLIGGFESESNGDSFLSGWIAGGVTGAICGAAAGAGGMIMASAATATEITAGSIYGLTALGLSVSSAGGFVGGFSGSLLNDKLNGRDFDYDKATRKGFSYAISNALAAPFAMYTSGLGTFGLRIGQRITAAVGEGICDAANYLIQEIIDLF